MAVIPLTDTGRAVVAVLAALLLAGCAYRAQRADSDPPSADPLLVYQTQVATGDCIFRPPDAAKKMRSLLDPITGALLSSAIEQGVNSVGKALQEAASETNDLANAARNVEVTAKTFGSCLQVARGWFHRGFFDDAQRKFAQAQAVVTWAAPGSDRVIGPGNLDLFWKRRMWLAAQPDFLFEAQVVPSAVAAGADSKLLTLAPVYARLDYPISRALLRPSKARDVGVYFAFHAPTENPEAPGTANGGLILGHLRPGVAILFPPPVVDTGETPNRGADESRWFTIALGDDPKAMTISALVSEHQDSSPFLQFWADVFGGAQAPITSALQTALVPSQRQQAAASETTAAETARTAYEQALVSALDAATACASGATSGLAAASAVRGALRTFNQAARALNGSVIGEDTVPLSNDAPKVQAGCAKAQQQLLAKV